MNGHLTTLVSRWHSLKQLQDHYTAERLEVEKSIQRYLCEENKWKLSGTMTLGELKIRAVLKRKWNQDKLSRIRETHQLLPNQFPFQIEYKENKSQSEYLEEEESDIWQLLRPALTVYPSKPYFFSAKKED
ncbi:MAG: hypothetical protein U1E78_11810 [Gammaproteobacteria bacterium]